jgi:hypothetical protein
VQSRRQPTECQPPRPPRWWRRRPDGARSGRRLRSSLRRVAAGAAACATFAAPLQRARDALTGFGFSHTVVAATPTSDGKGFWLAYADGTVEAVGDATYYGDAVGIHLNAPIVGITASPDDHGYWLLGADGGVFTLGDAAFYGSTGGLRLNAPALQMQATPSSKGYYFVAGDGGVFTFGNAPFYGSTGGIHLNRPVVGMAETPDDQGYWLVAADGGVFTFGNAPFYGSTGGIRLNRPVVGMAPTPDGRGYWLVAADGGVFTFGDAAFHGSGVGQTSGAIPVNIVPTSDGGGYWIPLSDGQVLSFGDAPAIKVPENPTTPGPPAPDSRYTFEVVNAAGEPARWNPCETIRYAVVTAGAPAGWAADVATAIAKVSAATGIRFSLAGYYPSGAGVGAPLVIDWKSTIIGGDTVGLATYWYYNLAAYTPQIVKAEIDLKTGLPGGFGPSGEGPILLHELGHAMGLDHVPGQPEVMNPYDQGFSSYQLGDLNGLWRVGAASGCQGFIQ